MIKQKNKRVFLNFENCLTPYNLLNSQPDDDYRSVSRGSLAQFYKQKVFKKWGLVVRQDDINTITFTLNRENFIKSISECKNKKILKIEMSCINFNIQYFNFLLYGKEIKNDNYI